MAAAGGHWVKGSFQPAGGAGAGEPDINTEDMGWAEYTGLVENLTDDTTLRLYSGMQWADEINEFLEKGMIDPTQSFERGRIFESGAEEGIFATPWRKIGSGFGPYTLEYDAPVKDLAATPQPGNITTSAGLDEFWRSSYPNSSRPGLTSTLKLSEAEALLVRPAKLRAIWTNSGRERIPIEQISHIDPRKGVIKR